MEYVKIQLFTTQPIKDKEIAVRYFTTLEQRGLRLEKVGQYEPVRQPYSLENAVDAWMHESPGCYVESVGMVGKAGSMIGKSSKPRFFMLTQWWECPNQVNINWVSLTINYNFVDKNQETTVALFKDSINILKADYGFIGHEDTVRRQHVAGTLETRLPGVFWCNYFGPKYVGFFAEDKIKSFPWFSIEQLNGGVVTCLTDSQKKLLDTDEIENAAKEHLGSDSFGDVDAFRKNPRNVQRRRVPNLL